MDLEDKVKKNVYVGVFVNYLLFSATTPLISIFFIQKVSTIVFSIVNWVSIIIVLIMNNFLKSQRNRDFLQRFFLPIIIIDTVLFIIVSFVGEYHVDVRFFGLAVLNGTTSAIWMCIMKSNINKVFAGDNLTNFQTYQDYLISVSQLIGATVAVVLTKLNIDINILMSIQIIASVTMGYFDYKTIKIINE
jgi:hypothetical protein